METLLRRHEGHEHEADTHGHQSTHYANLAYGNYILGFSVLYLVFLFCMRRYVVIGERTNKVVKQICRVRPLIHMGIILAAVIIPFYQPHLNKLTVYYKRLGRLSYALISLNLILMLRPNWLLSKNYTYTDFVPLHKWLSRFIVVAALVHGILFFVHWGKSTNPDVTILSKIMIPENADGVVTFFLLFLILPLSIGPFRQLSYTVFYIVHNIANFALIVLTPFHARPGVTLPFFVINLIILLAMAYGKINYVSKTQLIRKDSVLNHDKKSSIVVAQLQRSAVQEIFQPGCHIRISPYQIYNPLYWLLPSHPYTVVSLPEDNEIELILLENIRKYSFRLHLERSYTIINQYDPAVPQSCLDEASRICIVCGGTGISFGLPLFKHFYKASKSNQREIKYLRFVWLIKEKSQVKLLEKLMSCQSLLNDDNFTSKIHLFITRSAAMPADEENTFELENLTVDDPTAIYNFGSVNLGRRIDWLTDLSTFVEHEDNMRNTWLLSCGPKSLVDSADKFATKAGIRFASEVYSL